MLHSSIFYLTRDGMKLVSDRRIHVRRRNKGGDGSSLGAQKIYFVNDFERQYNATAREPDIVIPR